MRKGECGSVEGCELDEEFVVEIAVRVVGVVRKGDGVAGVGEDGGRGTSGGDAEHG